MKNVPDIYLGPRDFAAIAEGDVYRALDFLVAVEPNPSVFTEGEYDAATMQYQEEIKLATLTLTGFALQRQPLNPEDMRSLYERFVRMPRYRRCRAAAAVAGSLSKAWDKVGPWQCCLSSLWRPYLGPDEPERLTEEDVRLALDFLVAIEPDPPPATLEDYKAALAPFRQEIARAEWTLRNFAAQGQPTSIERMRADYYGFTNDQRYLRSPKVSSVVTSALSVAWDGVGPWRR
jgi:hypothetical protein